MAVTLLAGAATYGLGRLRGPPDRGRLVYATQSGVYVRELGTGEQRRVAELPDDTVGSWPDPGGRWLGYARRGGDVWLLDLRSGARWQISDRLTTALGWTPDRRLVVAELGSDRDLVAVDPGDRGTDLLVTGFPPAPAVWLGDRRFASVIDAQLVMFSTPGPQIRPLHLEAVPLAASPDGRELLVTIPGSDPRVAIADVEDDELGTRRVVFEGEATRAAVSSQGFVAFAGRDGSGAEGTWVLEGSDEPARLVVPQAAEDIAWSLDGSALVLVVDGDVIAVELRDDRKVTLARRGRVASVAVVP